MIAFCFRSGHIQFGAIVPEGAIEIARSRAAKRLQTVIEVLARWSYPSKRGGNDSVPLVPGVPEAESDQAAGDALARFRDLVAERLKRKAA